MPPHPHPAHGCPQLCQDPSPGRGGGLCCLHGAASALAVVPKCLETHLQTVPGCLQTCPAIMQGHVHGIETPRPVQGKGSGAPAHIRPCPAQGPFPAHTPGASGEVTDSGFRGDDLAMRERRGRWASAMPWACLGEMIGSTSPRPHPRRAKDRAGRRGCQCLGSPLPA